MSEYFNSESSPVRENLKFFIGLRNKIEHRSVPTIDSHVSGECQAMLLNFDEFITKEFGTYYALKETLAIPLQTSNIRTPSQINAMKKFQGKQYEELIEYIESYRISLPDEIYVDPKYSFRVYLLQKIGNHKSSSDLAVEFVKFDPNNAKEFEDYKKALVLIKDKTIFVANAGKFKPSMIAKIVAEKLNNKFTVSNHVQAWKYYKVRQQGNKPDGCNTDYCQFDEAHNDYIYTEKWIDFLVEKLLIMKSIIK